jgi:hypothetical protein
MASPHPQLDVVAPEPRHHHVRVPEMQPVHDVVTDRRRSGRRQRDHLRLPELVEQLPEAQVVGAEVVPPRGHAVRLVDRHQAGS